MKKVNILGVEYTIIFDVEEENMTEGADGCMDQSTRTIKVAKLEFDRNSLQDLEEYKKKVLRHETIHAFFYESGVWNCSGTSDSWGQNEAITDWFAIQAPKIHAAFETAGCI